MNYVKPYYRYYRNHQVETISFGDGSELLLKQNHQDNKQRPFINYSYVGLTITTELIFLNAQFLHSNKINKPK